jgi:hypothetical protein
MLDLANPALLRKNQDREGSMPTDALLLSIAICFVFAFFAVALAWLDHSTTTWLRSQAADKARSPDASLAKKAA